MVALKCAIIVRFLPNVRKEMKRGERVWSQEDLGDAAGLKKETVYRMEHDRNPLILENMGRRALVASALGTLAGNQEPTIFRLFGLDPQAYGVHVSVHDIIPEVHGLPEYLTDEILYDYQQTLASFSQSITLDMHKRWLQMQMHSRQGIIGRLSILPLGH